MGITIGSVCLEEEVLYPVWLVLLYVAPWRPHHTAGRLECVQTLPLSGHWDEGRGRSQCLSYLHSRLPHSLASQGQNHHLLGDPNFRAKFESDAVVHNYNSNTQEAEAGQFGA
jgi:hypothetical protein